MTHLPVGVLVATAAHGFAIMGVRVGIFALAAGLGPTTTTSTIYHRAPLLLVCLALLQTPAAKAALGVALTPTTARPQRERPH